LAASLEASGLTVWWDRNISGGAEFSQQIETELEAAAHVIVAWSGNSLTSHWVRDEAELARERAKLVPLSIDGSAPPLGFRQLHALNFDGWTGDTSAPCYVDLLSSIGPSQEPVSAGSKPKRTWDKPSVAVLPFNNMSSDEEIEHVADGIAEDLISSLSTIQHLSVTARNSTFVYKGQAVDIRETAEALGVRYIVEGSVRKLGPRIRVTAQFIEAKTGTHIWAKKFDQSLEDFYEAPDDIVDKISGSVFGQLIFAESDRSELLPDEEVGAWEYCQRSTTAMIRGAGGASVFRQMAADLKRALEIEPDYALGHAHLSWVSIAAYINGAWEDGEETDLLEQYRKHLLRARELANDDLLVMTYIGAAENFAGEQDQSVQTLEQVLERNPAMAAAWNMICMTYASLGRFDDARTAIAKADELAPDGGYSANHGWYMGLTEFMAGEYEKARRLIERSVTQAPEYGYANILVAICAHHAGDHSDVRRYIKQAKHYNPQLRPSKLAPMVLAQATEGKGEKDYALIEELWG
jgi:TolB-like protein/Flp pilus assembly protein TadD